MREMKELEIKGLIIRPMEEQDAQMAGELEERVFSMPWKPGDFIEMINAPYAHYFVAVLNDLVVGIIGLRDIAGEGEITNVVVSPEHRRCGIGYALLERALSECKVLNIKDVTLEVRVSNAGAISLYEGFGFKGEGVRPNFYERPIEDALIMWKRD